MVCRDKLRFSKKGCSSRKVINGRLSSITETGNQSTQTSPSERRRSFDHRPFTMKWMSDGTDEVPSRTSSSRLGHLTMSISQKFLKAGESTLLHHDGVQAVDESRP